VFVVRLIIQGIHETAEQHFVPYSDIIHTATESLGPDSVFGHLLTYLLAILPMGWVATAWMTGRRVIASR
jgi:hypothetical protein